MSIMRSHLQGVISSQSANMSQRLPPYAQFRERNCLRLQHLSHVSSPVHPRHVESPNWWDCSSSVRSNSLSLAWPMTKHCSKCGTSMLNTEWNPSWCCFNGQYPPLALWDYPPNIDASLSEGSASDISRKPNNHFFVSKISVQGCLQNLRSPSSVIHFSRSSDWMLHIEQGQHPLRWVI